MVHFKGIRGSAQIAMERQGHMIQIQLEQFDTKGPPARLTIWHVYKRQIFHLLKIISMIQLECKTT